LRKSRRRLVAPLPATFVVLIQINTAALALGRAARNLDPVVFGKLPDQRPSASASWFTFRNLR
jgi:hypothetical protein